MEHSTGKGRARLGVIVRRAWATSVLAGLVFAVSPLTAHAATALGASGHGARPDGVQACAACDQY
jgi:hypothetical protein